MSDLMFAVAHHLVAFALVAILAAEYFALRPDIDPAGVRRLARIDLVYGVLAGAILAIGFGRAVFAAKGWAYYSGNTFFAAKIAAFLLIGLLSIPPTVTYFRWRKSGIVPSGAEVAKVRRYLLAELLLFAPLLAFAAAMARGLGMQ
jgi:putative membrane protein